MKQIFTLLVAFLLLQTTGANGQTFLPESYINRLNDPARVFKSHISADSMVLKSVSVEVNASDPELSHLISLMYRTVTDSLSRGVGIAAPQIGINKRVILVQRLDKEEKPFEAYLNPKIIQFSKLMALRSEGCLSIDDCRAEVERSYAILISYITVSGEERIEMVEDFTARIFQHEIDHLDGILFVERIKMNNRTTDVSR
jgi:peptide deformylase